MGQGYDSWTIHALKSRVCFEFRNEATCIIESINLGVRSSQFISSIGHSPTVLRAWLFSISRSSQLTASIDICRDKVSIKSLCLTGTKLFFSWSVLAVLRTSIYLTRAHPSNRMSVLHQHSVHDRCSDPFRLACDISVEEDLP
jgi:hypothetical protein